MVLKDNLCKCVKRLTVLWPVGGKKTVPHLGCFWFDGAISIEQSMRGEESFTMQWAFFPSLSGRYKKWTFDVAIILRMVLGFLVERYFEVLGHLLPFLWCRMEEEGGQFDSELETDEWKTFCTIGIHRLIYTMISIFKFKYLNLATVFVYTESLTL